MDIYTDFPQPHIFAQQGCVATIGNFDGVHKGHQALLAAAVKKARCLHVPAVAITFDPHPLQFLAAAQAPILLTSIQKRITYMEQLGIDALVVIPFTHDFANLSADKFVRQFLVEHLHIKHICIGYDYTFGKGRAGTKELLEELGLQYGFSVEQLAEVQEEGITVSSTAIRQKLAQGDVRGANAMLGRPYCIHGTVIHGKGRGGTLLGFPTANLSSSQVLLPAEGVYAVRAFLDLPATVAWADDRQALSGVASVGTNPTFQDGTLRAEIHLLDFEQDIYGRTLYVAFIDWIRSQQVFSDVTALVAGIGHDICVAREKLHAAGYAVDMKETL